MQANNIILTVDTANDTLVMRDRDYTRIDKVGDTSSYIRKGTHTTEKRDVLNLVRTHARPSGNDRGVRKCAIRLTRDQEVANRDGSGVLVKPLICEVRFAIPEGTDKAQVTEIGQTILAALDRQDIVDDLCEILEI